MERRQENQYKCNKKALLQYGESDIKISNAPVHQKTSSNVVFWIYFITCRCHMSARRSRITSFGAFLLSMFNALSCDTDIVPGGCCAAAVPLVEGPCTFVPERDGDVLGSAASASRTPVSSCAVAWPDGAFALAACIRFLTIIFQTQYKTAINQSKQI